MAGRDFGGLPVINVKATGNNIDRLRTESGITCYEIQYTCGVSFQAVYKWMRGKNLPSIDHLVILADMLDVTVDDLLVVDLT